MDDGKSFIYDIDKVFVYGKRDIVLEICVITNYVRQPKMNGFVERFNRSLKEKVLQYNDVYTVEEVNECLKRYIITYNFDRVHDSLGEPL